MSKRKKICELYGIIIINLNLDVDPYHKNNNYHLKQSFPDPDPAPQHTPQKYRGFFHILAICPEET